MSIITTVNFNFDFWELYPDLLIIDEFKKLKDKFKKDSSKVMWFIYACFDLGSDNKFKNLEFSERVKILGKDILKDEKFYFDNEKFLQAPIDMYIKLNDTPAKRHMRQWIDTLEKRTKFLKEAEYSLDNYDKIDKMAANTAAIFKTFDEINKQMNKEEGSNTTKGGYIPSMNDDDDI